MTIPPDHPPPPLALRATGPFACFTRPELKAERMSYPIITPSAARGIFEAILWKPGMRWRIERINVLAPIAFTAFRRNEVGTPAVPPTRANLESGGEYEQLLVEDRRQQRNTVALRDVDYVLEARIELTDKAGETDNMAKFVEMFQRRVERGQRFHQPYLGCREFTADVRPVDEGTPDPIDETRDLGVMLWDIQFATDEKGRPRNSPVFFAAKLDHGVLAVPANRKAAEATLRTAHGPLHNREDV